MREIAFLNAAIPVRKLLHCCSLTEHNLQQKLTSDFLPGEDIILPPQKVNSKMLSDTAF